MPLDARNPAALAANAHHLARVIRDERVTLAHVRSRAPAFSALAAAKLAGVPLIATYHGAYAASWAGKRWYNRIMTAGAAVIANSPFIAEHIAAQHPAAAAKTVLIPEGIDVARLDPARVSAERLATVRAQWGIAAEEIASGTRRRVLLLAGRLAPIKGQRFAVEVLARLRIEPAPILILAGREGRLGETALIAAAAERLGVASKVRLVGPCPDMPAAYLAADLVIAPSLVPESFGRTVIEAAAMARPVLASAAGAFCQSVIEARTGWLAPVGEAEAWAAALTTALEAPAATLRRMGEEARARAVELYSLQTMGAATFALYRSVLEGWEWRRDPRKRP